MKYIPYVTFLAVSALLVSCGDPIASSSNESSLSSLSDSTVISSTTVSSSSEAVNRLRVSEMMEDMENGNYTLTFTLDSYDIYYYEVDQELVYGSFFDPESNETVNFYVDLTNEESAVMYTQIENNQWITAPLDPFSTILLLSPLGFIDPLLVDDAWFTFDETQGVYVLSPAYYDDLFVGVESTDDMNEVTVHGNPETGAIEIIVKSVHPEDDSLVQTVIISYTDIGTTQVTLPTNLLDFPTYFIDTVLTETNNHSYLYTIEENVPSNEEIVPIVDLLGQRDGDAYLLTDYETFNQQYVHITSEGDFELITSFQGSTDSEIIDQETYDDLVSTFYPLNVLALESSWIDLQQPTLNSELNVAMYPLLPEGIDALIQDPFLEDATNMVGQILFYESLFTGPLVNIQLEFEKEGTPYLADFSLLYFDQTILYPPYIIQPTELNDVLVNVQTMQNYSLSQTRSEGQIYEVEYYAERDGKTFKIEDGEDFSVPATYYEWDGVNYLEWSQNDNGDYTSSIIDETLYAQATTDPFLLNLDTLLPEDILEDTTTGDYYLNPTSYTTLIRDDILEAYTIEEVSINAYGSLDSIASVYIAIHATNNTTSQPAVWMMGITSIGLSHIDLPSN